MPYTVSYEIKTLEGEGVVRKKHRKNLKTLQ